MSKFLKERIAAFADNLIFWLFLVGGGLVISFLTAQSVNQQGQPLHLIIFWVLVCLFIFTLIVNAIHIAWIRQERENRESKDKWLHDLAANHREEIGRYVPILDISVSLNPNSPTPYARFAIWYYNASVYTISIDPTPKGSVSYAGRRLTQPIELITRYRLDNLKNGFSSYIEFYQWLTKEELDFIMNDENWANHYFDLSQLIFTIVGSKPEMGVTPQALPYDLKHEVRLPR